MNAVAQTLPVAHTIRAQLGGDRFALMTGARDFVGGDRMLQFRLPRGMARHSINSVRVTLEQNDTYTVVFYAIRGTKFRTVDTFETVYADNLRSIFENRTGLKVSL